MFVKSVIYMIDYLKILLLLTFSANQTGVPTSGIMTEDSQRTAYQPQLRILKRQSGSGAQSQANSSDGNSKVLYLHSTVDFGDTHILGG